MEIIKKRLKPFMNLYMLVVFSVNSIALAGVMNEYLMYVVLANFLAFMLSLSYDYLFKGVEEGVEK